jgi:hypothetical protein
MGTTVLTVRTPKSAPIVGFPLLFLGLIAVLPSSALALPVVYGDREYCSNGNLSDTGGPSVFDGKTIRGQDWACDLKGHCVGGQDWACDLEGHCEGEGQGWADKFALSATEDKSAVVITYPDGRMYTLHRCSGD